MALFEGYERRIDKINGVLKEYGISSIEEAKEICDKAGVDAYNIVKGIQPIAFDNASWAYTLGAAIAIKKGIKTAEQAQMETQFYSNLMGGIRKALGIVNDKGLNTNQIKSVTKWISEYQLPDDVIINACERAAAKEVSKPFAYASKIIEDWHKDGVKSIEDIAKREKAYMSGIATANPVADRRNKATYNQFNDYSQRVYSKDEEIELERRLVMRNSHTQEERDALAERLKNS